MAINLSPAAACARAVIRYASMVERDVQQPAAWHAIAARLSAAAADNALVGSHERAWSCRDRASDARDRATRLGHARYTRLSDAGMVSY